MKYFLFALLLLAPVSAFACEGFEQDMTALEAIVKTAAQSTPQAASFGSEFSSKDDLKRWTETSTLGGGHIEPHQFAGKNFIFAFRSYTSGIKSSDAAVYMENGEGWKLVKSHAPLMGQWIEASRQDDQMVFVPDSGGAPIMVLTKSDVAGL